MPDLRDKVMKFYDDHYSANLMSLSLVGNHSLDELQKLAEENFNPVVNKDYSHPDYTEEVVFDNETGLGHIIKMVPLKDVKQLSIKWPALPDLRAFWREKPGHYIAHTIGHEGKNSLLSELIKQDLAISLTAGSSDRMSR